MYDPVSSYGIVKANQESFGKAVIPSYDFAKAQTVVSFGADFLGTWINPNKFSRDFIQNRKLDQGKKACRACTNLRPTCRLPVQTLITELPL
jgi:hypothetical protein